MTDIERSALMGDWIAQMKCTDNWIVLPCPCCGGKADYWEDSCAHKGYVQCMDCELTIEDSSKEKAILSWNTRIVPPVGKCEDCLYFKPKNSAGTQGICMCKEMEMNCGGELYPLHDYYCKYFKQKERE